MGAAFFSLEKSLGTIKGKTVISLPGVYTYFVIGSLSLLYCSNTRYYGALHCCYISKQGTGCVPSFLFFSSLRSSSLHLAGANVFSSNS